MKRTNEGAEEDASEQVVRGIRNSVGDVVVVVELELGIHMPDTAFLVVSLALVDVTSVPGSGAGSIDHWRRGSVYRSSFDDSVGLEPIDQRHMDSVLEEAKIDGTLAYMMVRPYIVVVVDWDIEPYAACANVDVHCTHIEALALVVVDYTGKNHMDFGNSHKDLPFLSGRFRNHHDRSIQLVCFHAQVRSELVIQVLELDLRATRDRWWGWD